MGLGHRYGIDTSQYSYSYYRKKIASAADDVDSDDDDDAHREHAHEVHRHVQPAELAGEPRLAHRQQQRDGCLRRGHLLWRGEGA